MIKSLKKERILIVRPRKESGGSLVLSLLCKLLRERGYDARIMYIHRQPVKGDNMMLWWLHWLKDFFKGILEQFKTLCVRKGIFTPFISPNVQNAELEGIKVQYFPFFDRNKTIIVYPERVYGNFLHAKQIVRWLLYYYMYKNDLQAYQSGDLFIAFREQFNEIDLNPNQWIVQLNYFDKQKYRQYNFKERQGCCYIIRKGYSRADLPSMFDGPIIDDWSEEAKVAMFNECKFCYFYDAQTFYTVIAAVCGCIPIVVLEEGKNKMDYLKGDEVNSMFGVAYGKTDDEIEYAVRTRKDLLQSLDYDVSNAIAVDTFVAALAQEFDFIKYNDNNGK